ncbi:sigma-70 family RNA polymerase sigma factor [Mycobacteroides abscessus]|uniref:sigma-70 family RNA polymerase sigma factor n=1 Tax=Mycobacteroides abscessus TaxID=36809 RepID=UPI0005DB22D4|nr:sigma-70 family RNA polymerase sigma factor [Mycobacteroides abscessus]MBE5509176.1 ECF RNA polymerase sigma factor SigD [Mycobacteroides abscessus]MBN7386827.1 sigma-70 family RNA polymerase sigma factor [Mycobacteroides abscessus subsp. abscessus]MBN7416458.1 sigma-70 family RNA polymerase sigma factor [Mycobacteroides abscessus subsp. abscessus]MBN7484309.1 sigma-70 family RNA polymerase sigma factor [Mycobacteroides abscessus subsp. abscessus]MBN7499052.1 sigma-70 family RNA polymerase 
MTSTESGLDDVVAAAVRGDRDALSEVLSAIRPVVVRYCRARVGTAERSGLSADDVAQEVCLAVIAALPRYQDQGRPFLAFVYGIAAHKVADAHRAMARDKSDPAENLPEQVDRHAGPEQEALNSESSRRMQALLEVLPEKQREILILRVVVGLSAEETADAVGSSAGAVRVAQHRALQKLKAEMTRAGEYRG